MTLENKLSNRKRASQPQLLRLGIQVADQNTGIICILPAHAWSQPYYRYHCYSFKIFRRF